MAKLLATQEIAKHAQNNDIWIVVNGKVYDVTKFAPDHPGGAESNMKIRDSSHSEKFPANWPSKLFINLLVAMHLKNTIARTHLH